MLLTVDTLAFAVEQMTLDDLLYFLRLSKSDFEPGRGFNLNYEKSIYLGGIKIGYENHKTRFSCYVNMSGQGCRTYESYNGEGFEWESFINRLADCPFVDFRRVDIACDDRSGDFDVRKCVRYYEAGKIAGCCRTFKYTLGSEEIFYCGSPQSDTLVRIYNKLMERGFAPEDQAPWIRCEIQLRDTAAKQFIGEWLSSGSLQKIYCGHLLEFVRFLTKPNNKENSQRIPVAPFWLKFCQGAERIKFISSPGVEYNIKKLDNFINHQVASSIKTYLLTHEFDMQDFFDHFLREEIKLNKDQQYLIRKRTNEAVLKRLSFTVDSPDDTQFDSYQFKLDLLDKILRG